MDADQPGAGSVDPLDQDEELTLQAELRQALQHQRAAQERADELGRDLQRLMNKAREIIQRRREAAGAPDPIIDADPVPPTPDERSGAGD